MEATNLRLNLNAIIKDLSMQTMHAKVIEISSSDLRKIAMLTLRTSKFLPNIMNLNLIMKTGECIHHSKINEHTNITRSRQFVDRLR